jgi:hypothetical protein
MQGLAATGHRSSGQPYSGRNDDQGRNQPTDHSRERIVVGRPGTVTFCQEDEEGRATLARPPSSRSDKMQSPAPAVSNLAAARSIKGKEERASSMPDTRDIILLSFVFLGVATLCVWLHRVHRSFRLNHLLGCPSFFERGPERFSLMTHTQALTYFITDRPADPKAKNGAMLLESHDEGYLFTQAFLDAGYELVLRTTGDPYGRKVVVHELDDHLKKAFARRKAFHGKKVLFVPGVSRLLATTSDVAVMRYVDAMSYFATRGPRYRASRGAMLLKRGIRKHIFQQVFLDERDGLLCAAGGKPYGRQCYVLALDGELTKLFADRTVVIIDGNKPPQLGQQRTSATEHAPLPDSHHSDANPSPAVAEPSQAPAGGGEPQCLHSSRYPPRFPSEAPSQHSPAPPSPEGSTPTLQDGVLTYKAALTYFVTARPADPRVKKGAIRLVRHHKGYTVEQVFLDAQSEPVRGPTGRFYGRSLMVKDLDRELWETFAGKQLIIVE